MPTLAGHRGAGAGHGHLRSAGKPPETGPAATRPTPSRGPSHGPLPHGLARRTAGRGAHRGLTAAPNEDAAMTVAHLNRIATAVPEFDVHEKFVAYAPELLADERSRRLFRRMAERAQIDHRYSFVEPHPSPRQLDRVGPVHPRRLRRHGGPHALLRRARLPAGRGGRGRAGCRPAAGDGHPSDRHQLHRLLRAGPRPADRRAVRAAARRRADHDRLHGLPGGPARSQARPPHRPLAARSPGADGQSRAVHAAPAGDQRPRERACRS